MICRLRVVQEVPEVGSPTGARARRGPCQRWGRRPWGMKNEVGRSRVYGQRTHKAPPAWVRYPRLRVPGALGGGGVAAPLSAVSGAPAALRTAHHPLRTPSVAWPAPQNSLAASSTQRTLSCKQFGLTRLFLLVTHRCVLVGTGGQHRVCTTLTLRGRPVSTSHCLGSASR